MDQLGVEKRLSLCYLVCVALGGITSISTGVAWGHWYRTLDQCVGRNCSCIIYGKNTLSHFLGGGQSPCIWVTFGPLIYVFFCLCMTCFHGYRVLFTTKSPRTRTTRSVLAKMEHGSTVQITTITQEDTSPLPRTFWITLSVLSSLFFAYALIHFAIFVDGYYTTCGQYKRVLEKLLRVDGTAQPVIYRRLYCQSIFDFMDYMQLDTGNAYTSGYINTGLALSFGLSASFFAWVLLFMAGVLNVIMAKRREYV
ncbi:uncharacterized protein LOC126750615 [Anthonomus grandis grandis]|uniref:uncharacterized protein LOC126750615 n=1 Tax=Anthonomus grandis grandis TaxID=2921223 RepID=UPI00216688D4|nr:uncharacterized protein LOC126750615 [Anthonomus grandis grandis]